MPHRLVIAVLTQEEDSSPRYCRFYTQERTHRLVVFSLPYPGLYVLLLLLYPGLYVPPAPAVPHGGVPPAVPHGGVPPAVLHGGVPPAVPWVQIPPAVPGCRSLLLFNLTWVYLSLLLPSRGYTSPCSCCTGCASCSCCTGCTLLLLLSVTWVYLILPAVRNMGIPHPSCCTGLGVPPAVPAVPG